MSIIFVKQPNGLIALFSASHNYFTHWDMTEADARDALESEIRRLTNNLHNCLDGNSHVTWERCLAEARSADHSEEWRAYIEHVLASAEHTQESK